MRWFGRGARIEAKLDQILKNQRELLKMSTTQAASTADLQAAVTADTAIGSSVLTLANGIIAQLNAALAADKANGVDAAAVTAAVAQLQANATNMAAWVTANTPAAPAPVAAPVTPTP